VILHDPENNQDNSWLATIKNIKMRQTPGEFEVWVSIQWYYSAKDLVDRSIPLKDL
jgi:hypothetical protein